MFSCTRSFTTSDDLYSDISIEFRSTTIIYVSDEQLKVNHLLVAAL